MRVLPAHFPCLYFTGVLLLSGCVSQTHAPYQGYSETQLEAVLMDIHDRLGYTAADLRKELANSQGYTREQAADLKQRIANLIVAYEKLYHEADCAQRAKKQESRVCWEAKIRSAGFRFNAGILDSEHPDLPPLPKKRDDTP